jgi:hypothetical protein
MSYILRSFDLEFDFFLGNIEILSRFKLEIKNPSGSRLNAHVDYVKTRY